MERRRQTSVLRFGTYEVDPNSGELRKAGVRIKVQQQPLKLLEVLLEHPGEVVTREELRTRIWPNETFGEFDQAVNVSIAKLRSDLSDSADNPRYIETLPRRGYRFVAPVAVIPAEVEDSEPPPGASALSSADSALAAGGEVIGVIPQQLVDREVAHQGLSELRITSSMHERKALMAELSDGFVALPGG